MSTLRTDTMTDDELIALLPERDPRGYGTEHAASAARELGQREASVAVPALIDALSAPNYLCVCAARALARIGDPAAVGPLIEVLGDSTRFWVHRGAAAVCLGRFGENARAALPTLRTALTDPAGDDETWDERCISGVEEAILRIEAAIEGREHWCEPSGHTCPRCVEGVLLRRPDSTDAHAFLECSRCSWQFAQGPGEGVHDRWLSPLSLALYSVIFTRDPVQDVERVARDMSKQQTARWRRELREEIVRELARPTQRVCEIHDFAHSPREEDLREFLRGLAERLQPTS